MYSEYASGGCGEGGLDGVDCELVATMDCVRGGFAGQICVEYVCNSIETAERESLVF